MVGDVMLDLFHSSQPAGAGDGYQRCGQLAEMNWCRGMLRAFVGNNEGVRFSHLVCQQFEGEQVRYGRYGI